MSVGNVESPDPCGAGLSIEAVVEGFEPPMGCPILAFEASSFGHSDTLPRWILA